MSSLKKVYVSYYRDVPVQKYAAMAIGRDEDTIIRWKKEDKQFASNIQKAKAEWVRKKTIETKAEFALERLEAEVFGRKGKELDLTIAIPPPVVYLPAELPYSVVDSAT